MSSTVITVEATVNKPLAEVWQRWITPADIMQWNAASDDWHTTASSNDVRVGGIFSSTMAAKDGSMSFDFAGEYVLVEEQSRLVYKLGDAREVDVTFVSTEQGVLVTEKFEAESVHPPEMQQAGWQAILNRFKQYVEAR